MNFWLLPPEERHKIYLAKYGRKQRAGFVFTILWMLGILIPIGGVAAVAYIAWPTIAPLAEKALALLGW